MRAPRIDHIQYLVSLGADRGKDEGRTLLDHLKGTFYLLAEWGLAEQVCVAGLFHRLHRLRSMGAGVAGEEGREALRGLIGQAAERLAYCTSSMHRERFLDGLPSRVVEPADGGAGIEVTADEQRDLCDILLASQLEESPRLPRSEEQLARVEATVKRAAGCLSPSALSYHRRHYGRPGAMFPPAPRVTPRVSASDLLAPLSIAQFASAHWGKRFLHLPGSAGRFAHLFSWADLNAFLRHHRQEWRRDPRIRVHGPARDDEDLMVPVLSAERERARSSYRLDPTRLYDRLREGSNIQVFGANELTDGLQSLTEDLADLFCSTVHCYLFASTSSSTQGLPTHYDFQDFFVCQLDGSKDWTLYAPMERDPIRSPATLQQVLHVQQAQQDPQAASPYYRDLAEKIEQTPVWTGRLRAGDVLYVPRGYYHRVVPTREPSLHVSLPIDPITGIRVIEDLAAHELPRHHVFRENVPWLGTADDKAEYLHRLRQATLDALHDGCLDDVLRRDGPGRAALPAFNLPKNVEPVVLGEEANPRLSWRLPAPHRARVDARAETLTLVVHGRPIQFEGPAEAALQIVDFVREQRVVRLHDVYALGQALRLERDDVRALVACLVQNDVVDAELAADPPASGDCSRAVGGVELA